MKQAYMLLLNYLKDVPVGSSFQSHANYEIFYFHKGKGNYLIGDKIYVLSPGDLIIMHGMTLHCPKMDSAYPYVRTLINFDPAYIRAVSEPIFSFNVLEPFERLRNHRFHLQGEAREDFEALLAKMHRFDVPTDPLSYNRFRIAFIELLLLIHSFYKLPSPASQTLPSEKEQNVQKLITFVESHFTEDMNMDRLADAVHLNKHYLARTFREITGVTIFNYLYQRRINEAKMLFLLEREATVTEVCYRVGFKSLPHFCRLFKQMVGTTPEHFRRSL